jgi:poly(3-hydroxybutyrate) depolymerase
MREDIGFTSKGLSCRGWLYMPDGLTEGQRAPAIVMAHGLAGVKEMKLASFAATSQFGCP